MSVGDLFAGKRVRDVEPHQFEPGNYGLWHGGWYARTPNGHLGNLSGHEVKEHGDGAITVSPSIEVGSTKNGVPVSVWHGYLEHGIWREA